MTQNSEWAAIRQQHIKHEASLRSVGVLYYIGAIFGLLAAFGMLSGVLLGGLGGEEISMLVGILVFYFIFGIASIFIGRGLRQLRPWVKIPVTIFSGLGLLSIPIGTLINGYILYLMYSEKGKVVFSPEYQEIRDATPDIKYQTSKLAWGVLIVLVIALVAIIVSVSVG